MNSGITDPLDAITFPYRVRQNTVDVSLYMRALATMHFSIRAFDMPIAFTGYTALSVLRTITLLTLEATAAFIAFSAPSVLVCIASIGKNSQDGTCFSAAAWNTKSTPRIACKTLS